MVKKYLMPLEDIKKRDECIVFPAQNGFRIFKEDVPPGILK
jgi:hypothetical protein